MILTFPLHLFLTSMTSKLIDKGSYYEIANYEPIIERDKDGNILSMICCPYIPKILLNRKLDEITDGPDQLQEAGDVYRHPLR